MLRKSPMNSEINEPAIFQPKLKRQDRRYGYTTSCATIRLQQGTAEGEADLGWGLWDIFSEEKSL